jgi:hypothetical protein
MEKSDSDEDIMNILEPMNFDESIDDPSFMNSTINLKKNKEIDFYGESISNYINIVESIDKNNYIKFDNFLNENYLPDLTKKIMQFFVKNDHYFSNVDYDIDSNYYEKIKDLFQLIIDKKLEINCKMIKDNSKFYKKYYFIQFQAFIVYKICSNIIRYIIVILFNIRLSAYSGHLQVSISNLKYIFKNLKDDKFNDPTKKELNLTKILNNNKPIIFPIYNILGGNYGLRYCICGNCYICKNKNDFPFDNIIDYLNKLNLKENERDFEYTQLLYSERKKKNSPNNIDNITCSFCNNNKSELTKIFCDHFQGIDHLCIFYMCGNCFEEFYNKDYTKTNELCPNCYKYIVNFSYITSIENYMKYIKSNQDKNPENKENNLNF